MSSSSILVLNAKSVSDILDKVSIEELIANQRNVFKTYSQSSEAEWESPLRLACNTDYHTQLFMPSRIGQSCGIKCVAVPNPKGPPGLPGTGLSFDPASGRARALVDLTQLTAVRTAAGCLAASTIIQPSRKAPGGKLLVFGTGNQALWHARLFVAYYGLAQADFVTIEANSDAFKARVQSALGDKVSVNILQGGSDAVYEALSQADFVSGCTPSTQALFDWSRTQLKNNVHFSLIGSYKPHMQEVPPQLIEHAASNAALYVDSVDACSHEAGDLLKSSAGKDQWKEVGKSVESGNKDDFTNVVSVFKSVGISVQDVAVMDFVIDNATKAASGERVEF